MNEEKKGLNAKLEELNKKLELVTEQAKLTNKLKKKNFKVPFRVRSQLKKLAMKNKVQVILLQSNRNVKPIIADIKEGMITLGDKIYNGCTEGIWLWNGKYPTVILPEWDLNPITPSLLYAEAVKNKTLADPQTLIIRAMMMKESLQPKSFGGKTLIWVGIACVVIFYVIFAGGK